MGYQGLQNLHLHLVACVQEESWPEIARRQFLLLEVAAMVKALDSSGGLGPAVGAPGALMQTLLQQHHS